MYPHERSLVENYRNRPFALLGVNTDDDREPLKQAIARHGINWRSWFTGGLDSAILRQWQVTSFPTVFVIDAHGVIRHRLSSFQGIEALIEPLLREAGG